MLRLDERGQGLVAYTKTNSQVAIYTEMKPNVARKLKFLWRIAIQSGSHSDRGRGLMDSKFRFLAQAFHIRYII